MCEHGRENLNHLFLHCSIIRKLWHFVLTLVDARRDKCYIVKEEEQTGIDERRRVIPYSVYLGNTERQKMHRGQGLTKFKLKLTAKLILLFWCKNELVNDVSQILLVPYTLQEDSHLIFVCKNSTILVLFFINNIKPTVSKEKYLSLALILLSHSPTSFYFSLLSSRAISH